jgi:hypothetical protein
VSVFKIIKKDESEDSRIFGKQFYDLDISIRANELAKNEISIFSPIKTIEEAERDETEFLIDLMEQNAEKMDIPAPPEPVALPPVEVKVDKVLERRRKRRELEKQEGQEKPKQNIKLVIEKAMPEPVDDLFDPFSSTFDDEEDETPAPVKKVEAPPEPTETQKKKLARFFERAKLKTSTKNELKKVDTALNDKIKEYDELRKQFTIDPDDEYEAVREAQSQIKPPKKTKGKVSFDDVELTLSKEYNTGYRKPTKMKVEDFIKQVKQRHPDIESKMLDSNEYIKKQKDVESNLRDQFGKVRRALLPFEKSIRELKKTREELDNKLKDPTYKEKELLEDLKEQKETERKNEIIKAKLFKSMGLTKEQQDKVGSRLNIHFL